MANKDAKFATANGAIARRDGCGYWVRNTSVVSCDIRDARMSMAVDHALIDWNISVRISFCLRSRDIGAVLNNFYRRVIVATPVEDALLNWRGRCSRLEARARRKPLAMTSAQCAS